MPSCINVIHDIVPTFKSSLLNHQSIFIPVVEVGYYYVGKNKHYLSLHNIHLFSYLPTILVWPMPVGPSVNPLQNRETPHVNIVLQCMCRLWIFWTAKYERKSCLNWMVSLQSSVTTFSIDFFLPKPGFLAIYLNFQQQKWF
jgi:hypothetical protein